MKRDGRLSGVLHVLLHMAQKDGPVTSEVLAKALDTHPVVIRRVMAGLRDQGYVQSEKGHGGGWALACDFSKVTLRDIYNALGSPSLLAIGHRTEMPGCLVEEAVNAALNNAFQDAESLLLSRLGEVTLATLRADVSSRLAARGHVHHPKTGHGEVHPSHAHAHHHEHGHEHDHSHHHGHGAVGTHRFVDAEEWTKLFDDPARDAWQRPDEVLRALELSPTMTVADIGAGTGYFSVRLARLVPEGQVIAVDIEPDMVRYLNERARHEQLPNLHAILATSLASLAPTLTPSLTSSSLDRILIVHVWHHLTDRVEYARSLAAALRPGGSVLIVDFSSTANRGPPANMRVAPEVVIAELERAGLSAKISSIALPDQYIVDARRALR